MAISITSSLSFSPARSALDLTKSPSLFPSRKLHVQGSKKEPIWRNQAVPGLACVILGFGVCFFNCESGVYAGEIGVSEKVLRWSEKRKCPQWHENSLESFVPENLPRPWAHRKFDSIGLKSQSAPAVSIEIRNGCYSL